MKKKLLLLLILVISVLALAACGGEAEPQQPQVVEPAPPQPITLTTENYGEYISVTCEMLQNQYSDYSGVTPKRCTDVKFNIDAMITQTVSKINNVKLTVAVTCYVDRGSQYDGYEEVLETELMLSAMTGMGEAELYSDSALYELIGGPSLSSPDYELRSVTVTAISGEITP